MLDSELSPRLQVSHVLDSELSPRLQVNHVLDSESFESFL